MDRFGECSVFQAGCRKVPEKLCVQRILFPMYCSCCWGHLTLSFRTIDTVARGPYTS